MAGERPTTASGQQHEVTVFNREGVRLRGIAQVMSFDDRQVVLDTELGGLIVSGEDLHIKHLDLDNGEMEIEGFFSALSYGPASGRKSRRGVLSRLLK